MLSALSITDSSGSDVALISGQTRKISLAQGLVGIPGVRQVIRPRPNQHGSINQSRYQRERIITLDHVLTASGETALWTTYDTIFAALYTAVDTERTLKYTRTGSGLLLQTDVKLNDTTEPALSAANGGKLLTFQSQWTAQDPRAYGQTHTTNTGTALTAAAGGLIFKATFPWLFTQSGGGTCSVTNSGTVPTPPIYRVYGGCSSAQVQIVSTNERIVLTGTIATGDYLEIDVYERTVKLNGTTSRLNLVDFAATTWAELPTGSQTVRLIASNTDGSARVDVLTRPAYT